MQRHAIDMLCDDSKWIVKFEKSDEKVEFFGYSKENSRVFFVKCENEPSLDIEEYLINTDARVSYAIFTNSNGVAYTLNTEKGKFTKVNMSASLYSKILSAFDFYNKKKYIKKANEGFFKLSQETIFEKKLVEEGELNLDKRNYGFGVGINVNSQLYIGSVVKNSNSDFAGITKGDIVLELSLDGVEYTKDNLDEFSKSLANNPFHLKLMLYNGEEVFVRDLYSITKAERGLLVVRDKEDKEDKASDDCDSC